LAKSNSGSTQKLDHGVSAMNNSDPCRVDSVAVCLTAGC